MAFELSSKFLGQGCFLTGFFIFFAQAHMLQFLLNILKDTIFFERAPMKNICPDGLSYRFPLERFCQPMSVLTVIPTVVSLYSPSVVGSFPFTNFSTFSVDIEILLSNKVNFVSSHRPSKMVFFACSIIIQ